METPPEQKKCLNCGAVIIGGGKFCHECGQAVATERLSTRNFAVSILAGLTRINKGVLYTCLNLLVHPWQVIANYIRGQRVRYTGTVQLLLILTFLTVAVSALIGRPEAKAEFEDFPLFDAASLAGCMANSVIKFLLSSTVVQYLVVFIPAVPLLMLVNRRKGVARYNFAEYLLAAIYMSDAVLIFQLLVDPFDRLLPTSSIFLVYLYLFSVGTYGVYKSLNHLHLSKAKRIARTALFLFATILFYIIVISIPIALLYYTLSLPGYSQFIPIS